MPPMRAFRYCAFIISIVLMQAACGLASPEEQKAKHKSRGTEFFQSGKLNEALIEFANAVKLDPKDPDSRYQLAQTYVQLGGQDNLSSALGELIKTVEIQPSHHKAQLLLGALHLLSNDPDKALERADFVLKTSPTDTDGLILRANSLVRKMDFQQGIATYEKALAQDRSNPSLHIGLAQAYVAAQDFPAAERTLQRGLSALPRAPDLWIALGDLHNLKGNPGKAEETFQRGIQTAPENEALLLRLAQAYQNSKKLPQAEAIYVNLTKSHPEQERYFLFLGDYYYSLGNQDKALDSFIKGTKTQTASLMSRDKLIGHYIDTGNLEQAELLIKAALGKDSKDIGARLLHARVQVLRGKGEDTLSPLRVLVRERPNSPMAHEVLGMALSQTGNFRDAQAELEQAVRLAPQAVGPHIQLAQTHLAQRSFSLAIEQAEAALDLNPRNLAAAFLLGEAYRGKGDFAKAQTTFDLMAKAAPDYPGLQHRLGLVALAQRQPADAIQYFENALKTNPRSFESLAEILAVEMREGKTKDAGDRLARQIKLIPDSPTLYHLLGQYWVMVQENNNAIASFKRAIELDPNLLPAYISLGELYHRSGNIEEAEKEYEAVLAKDPSVVNAHMFLGMIEEGRLAYDKAIAHYERALTIMPKFAPAANNVAWLLIERGGNSDVALSHAQTAREGRPDDPTIADTLGWIYFKKNITLKATNLLREAAEKLPRNPTVQYHYGMALAQKGEIDRARAALLAALKLSQDFPGADAVRKQLKELDSKKLP